MDFPVTANGLYTEQVYDSIGPETTRLTFTVFYKNHHPGLWEEFKTYLAAYKIKRIFRENMNNIKSLVEAKS